MIKTLSIAVGLITFVNIVCVALDKIMHNRHKTRLYFSIQNLWSKLYKSNFPDLPKICASYAIALVDRNFGNILNSSRRFFKSLLFSMLITSIAYGIGQAIADKELVSLFSPREWSIVGASSVGGALWISYLVNYFFDVLTIAISYRVWKEITKADSPFSIILILVDFLLATTFAAFCAFSVALLIDLDADLDYAINTALFYIYYQYVLWEDVFYSATSLAPTLLFCIFLLVMCLAKYIVSSSKIGLLYIGEKVLEGEVPSGMNLVQFQPFTLLGVLLSVLGALLALLIVFFRSG